MRRSAIAQILMAMLFVAVCIGVVANWRSDDNEGTDAESFAPTLDEGVVSRTDGARYTQIANGVLRYQVFASRTVEYEDNRTTYEGGVELILYGLADAAGQVSETKVNAERLELARRPVPIDGDDIESIRVLDDVVAVLPNGEELRGDELTYSDERLWTDSGARLHRGGIIIESQYLSYNADTGVARMVRPHERSLRPDVPGPVRLWRSGGGASGGDAGDGDASDGDAGGGDTSDGDASGGAVDLEGSAGRLIYDLGLGELRLQQSPRLQLPQAAITGAEIVLFLAAATNDISGIESRRDARAVWLEAEGEGDYVAAGEVVAVALDAGAPVGFRVFSESEGIMRPRFDLGEGGNLRGDSIALGFGGGDASTVVSAGRAYFFPADDAAGLEYVGADTLTVGTGEAPVLEAAGDAQVELLGDSENNITFAGPRARFVFAEQELALGEWPEGITYEDPDGALSARAGDGEYDPASGDWVLSPGSGETPRFQSADFDVTAQSIRLLENGGTHLDGAVDARLRGDMVRTLGPLFGGAPEIQAAANTLRIEASGRRMEFAGVARIFQSAGDQLLTADEIFLNPTLNELQARGKVFVGLVDPPNPAAGRDEERSVLLSGQQLLIEGTPPRLTVAGQSLLELVGEERTIGGGRLTIELDDSGAWRTLEVHDNVVMADPAGTGRGARLEYDAVTDLMVMHAGENTQATFANDRGYDIRDPLGLRMEFGGDHLSVTAMQNGVTQLVRGGERRR